MYLGAHMSIAGGLHRAVERISSLEGTALQIFTRNQRQWRIPPLGESDIRAFRERWADWGDYPVGAHDSYLINLASPKREQRARSIETFAKELWRVEALSVPYLITHPGSHLGAGVEAGISTYVEALDEAIALSSTSEVMVLLENTAGQGTNLGSTFEQLASIFERSRHAGRLGICFDTCHAFAAGFELRTERGYDETFRHIDSVVGCRHIHFFHLNDSAYPLGSRRDRHQHIGEGHIGAFGFEMVLRDARFEGKAKVIETPKEGGTAADRRNLRLLRSLVG